MKRFLCGLAVCLALVARADQTPWVALFNGRDFSGWKLVGPPNLAPAAVADGAMILRQRVNTAEHTFVVSERNVRIITDQPERYAQPMPMPPRQAPSLPGKFDRPKRPRRRPRATGQRAHRPLGLPSHASAIEWTQPQ